MLIKFALLAAAFFVGYFVGANNPLASIKAKIAEEAKKLTGK